MTPIPVIAIFDIGKTNKKFFLFDEHSNEIKQEYNKIPLTEDEDGFECDDLVALSEWITSTVEEICQSPDYALKGINFSTYGASFVHIDADGNPLTPLYNYLKEIPQEIIDEFYRQYPEETNNLETASPSLGMLNSGLQLYWLKKTKPDLFSKIAYSLHFPQYLSYLFTKKAVSEPTSIGCHTRLWDFQKDQYHDWVKQEGIDRVLPDIVPTGQLYQVDLCGRKVDIGVGIHDSSSALASYLVRVKEPFLLISTGTWSISLNPFTTDPLTKDELHNDCLNFLSIEGKPVKASRFFMGYEFNYQIDRINKHFGKPDKFYKSVPANPAIIKAIKTGKVSNTFYPRHIAETPLVKALYEGNEWNPASFANFDEAYHHLIWGLTLLQVESLKLARGNSGIKKVFIDGGFVHNEVFMELLRYYLPESELEFSDFPLGSAYGAALVLEASEKKMA
ncbi:FGGY-family carbohydrate kinase [Echinicola vietnamensis]|uniref:Pentulose/hexulose kinase n=1 Tax=Echinicola vietnamensis (strain DSM 17526 / LMG 23754 / KMM 6221) TaxID=926556 RepID=L0FVB3_ECHVK|nr:FGGY family carbohydrate kinase [Echinicola vietnamensis]AGA77839.1 pentulose/hexulose kinase [Echinicola vietnamensis DSM 17526]